MSTQDDDLKIEPPQAQPPAPQPAPQATPEAPAPAPEPDDALKPGAGRPLVEGPPMSMGAPIDEQKINRAAAVGGIGLLGIGVIAALLLFLVVVLAVCTHH